jgi:hypothetical protein
MKQLLNFILLLASLQSIPMKVITVKEERYHYEQRIG